MKFKSSNKLKFYTQPHILAGAPTGMEKFKIGTVHGLLVKTAMSFDVYACINDKPGNGHMDDVFEWFFKFAKEGALAVRMINVSSVKFANELVEQRGFVATDMPDVFVKFVV